MMPRILATTALLAVLTCAGQAQAPLSSHAKEIARWRAHRLKDLKAPEGWLTLQGLFWLKEGANTLGAGTANDIVLPAPAPEVLGVLQLQGQTVHFKPASKATVPAKVTAKVMAKINDQPAHEADLRYDEKPDKLRLGPLTMIVIHRGERFALRLKNREAKTRREFKGLRYFPIDPKLRIVADWVPYDPPKMLAIPTILGTSEKMPSPGRAEFTIDGKKYTLEPVVEEPDAKELFVIFKDMTAAKETYGAGRFLYTPLPQNGKVVLDFNQAQNPPCAFTPYATCPIPPKQNVLALPIRAGEKSYGHPH